MVCLAECRALLNVGMIFNICGDGMWWRQMNLYVDEFYVSSL
jgi:hypothetical protein